MENKRTDFSKSLLLGFGQPVVSARLGNREKSQFVPRNEIGIVVMPAHKLNGTYLVYLPEHGHFYVAPRFNIKPFHIGEGGKFSLEDGQKLLTTLGTDGSWNIKNRGDENAIIKRYNDVITGIQLPEDNVPDQECWIPTAHINLSIVENDVLKQYLPTIHKAQESVSRPNTKEDVNVEIGWLDRTFGIEEKEDNEDTEEVIHNNNTSKSSTRLFNRRGRGTHSQRLALGASIVLATQSPSMSTLQEIMAKRTQISIDEHNRRNPTHKQAMNGPDRQKWIASKEKEDSFLETRGTFYVLLNQYHDLPMGVKPLHIVPKYKIKDDGTYKTRQVVLGNEDEWDGDRFSPTVSKAVVWLIFALSVLLKLHTNGLTFQELSSLRSLPGIST